MIRIEHPEQLWHKVTLALVSAVDKPPCENTRSPTPINTHAHDLAPLALWTAYKCRLALIFLCWLAVGGSASCQRNSSRAVSGAVREAGRDREVAIWKDRPPGVTWWSHTGSVVLSCWLSAPSASQADKIEAEAAGEKGTD